MLIRAVEHDQEVGSLNNDALRVLDELAFTLEVDAGARTGSDAQRRMSRLESDVLVPLLSQLRGEIATIPVRSRPRTWLQHARALDQQIAVGEQTMVQHSH